MLDSEHDVYTTLAALHAHPACKKSDARAFEVILEALMRHFKLTVDGQGHLDACHMIVAFRNLFSCRVPEGVAPDLPLVVVRQLVNACNQRCPLIYPGGQGQGQSKLDEGRAVARHLYEAVTKILAASQTGLDFLKDDYACLTHFAAWRSGFGAANMLGIPTRRLINAFLRLAPGMEGLGLRKMTSAVFNQIRLNTGFTDTDQSMAEANAAIQNAMLTLFTSAQAQELSPHEHGVVLAALASNLSASQCRPTIEWIVQRLDAARRHETVCACVAVLRATKQESIASTFAPLLAQADPQDMVVYARQMGDVASVLTHHAFYPGGRSDARLDETPDTISLIMRDRYRRGHAPLTRAQFRHELQCLCLLDLEPLPVGCHPLANRLRLEALCDLLHANRDLLDMADYRLALNHCCLQLVQTGLPDAPRSEEDSLHRAMLVARLYDLLGVLAKHELRTGRGDDAPQFATADYVLGLPAALDIEPYLTKEEFKKWQQAVRMLAAGHGPIPPTVSDSPTARLSAPAPGTTARTSAADGAAGIVATPSPATGAMTATATTATTSTTTAGGAADAPMIRTSDLLISLSMSPEEQAAVRARLPAEHDASRRSTVAKMLAAHERG